MDDSRFDSIIKKKADAFRDQGHDAHALADLRKRFSNLPAKSNGWTGARTAYIVGSIILFSLVNFGMVWYFSVGRHENLNDEIDQLRSERSSFIGLQEELSELRALKIDTVYIYRDVLKIQNIGAPVSSNTKDYQKAENPYSNESTANAQASLSGFYPSTTEEQRLSEELESFLERNNLLLRSDQGKMILIAYDQSVNPVSDFHLNRANGTTHLEMPDILSKVATYEQLAPVKEPEKKKIPNKMLWAMEKHNHKGVDFQFGVEAMFHKSNFDIGNGDINGGMGLMTEVIFSPVIRLETGIQLTARSYRINNDEISDLPPDFFDDYPGYDDQLGELIYMESDAELVKLPVNLKVFGILDHNKKWYASVGLTPQWAVSQEFDYKYELDTPVPSIGGSEFRSFVGLKQEVSSTYYTTTLNLGLGTEVFLNEKLRWQLGVFYQNALSKVGAENRKLHSFGVKSSLWFNHP